MVIALPATLAGVAQEGATVSLQSLEDFNHAQYARWERQQAVSPNGIACPECGKECVESASHLSLVENSNGPAKWKMRCSACAWTGTRYCA